MNGKRSIYGPAQGFWTKNRILSEERKVRKGKFYQLVRSGVITFFLLSFCETNFLLAQNIFFAPAAESVRIEKSHPKLEDILVQLVELYSAKGGEEANNFAREKAINLKEDKVKVIIVTKKDAFLSQRRLSRWEVKIEGRYQNLVEARVPLTFLKEVPNQFPEISFIRLPYRPLALDTSEGVGLIGASDYHSEGITGLNTKVAIIDLGFDNLTETIAHGDLPSSVITQDYSGTGLEADTKHGTGVAEVVYDLAPDAELHLLKIGNEVDLGLAKDYCVTNNINIINHSVGWVNTNFYDGTGIICGIANDARSKGILWVNAAGNEAAGAHWEGTFIDTDGDDYHEFDPGVDESDAIYAYKGDIIAVFLTWNDWPASDQDYDLYLYRGSLPNPVASSTRYQNGTQEPTEAIYYEVKKEGVYHVVIKKFSATSDHELELYSFYHDFQYWNPESSLMAPADATGVVAAGAINQADWTTGPQEYFSSQGPTNDGRIKPDLCGPDGTSGFTYGYLGFYGTSSASPHVAGAAALLLSANPGLSADQLQAELEVNAIDMGEVGKDNLYGSGRLNLPLLGVAPVITSTPVTVATVGQLYRYDVNATGTPEPNYALITSPDGMDINSITGLIQWTPDANQLGLNAVQVRASNGQPPGANQSFTITVLLSDNFDDNRRSAMWRSFADDYDNAWVVEDANRLNVRATGEVNDLVAFYVANGWSFDVNESFAVEVDFHYSDISDREGWVGITIENDDGYVSISAGSNSNESYFYYETIVDGNMVFEQEIRDSNVGTLYISYDADSNSVYLSHVGYGSENADTTLQVQWASPVDVAVGGGSDSVALGSGEAYLDNFEIATATLLGWPPATDLDSDSFIGWGDVEVMRDYWLVEDSPYGDINNDGTVNFVDFAEFALAW